MSRRSQPRPNSYVNVLARIQTPELEAGGALLQLHTEMAFLWSKENVQKVAVEPRLRMKYRGQSLIMSW